jgi:hypothetical protein
MDIWADSKEGVGERRIADGVQGWGWIKALRVKEVDI